MTVTITFSGATLDEAMQAAGDAVDTYWNGPVSGIDSAPTVEHFVDQFEAAVGEYRNAVGEYIEATSDVLAEGITAQKEAPLSMTPPEQAAPENTLKEGSNVKLTHADIRSLLGPLMSTPKADQVKALIKSFGGSVSAIPLEKLAEVHKAALALE
jgi:hypothetical protein